MKKIISSKSALILYSVSIPIIFAFAMIGLAFGIFGSVGENIFGFLLFAFFIAMLWLMVWTLNRAACIVWVEDGKVKSKGLIWGFYKECPILSIRKVKIEYSLHEAGRRAQKFIYLVNDGAEEYKRFFRVRKYGYISFKKNKKNLEFLKTFWSGPIEE